MSRLLFRMLLEFSLHTLARNARGGDRVHRVPQHADNLGREHGLQNLDRLLHIPLVSRRHSAFVDAGARPRSQLLDVREKRLFVFHLAILSGVRQRFRFLPRRFVYNRTSQTPARADSL